jgi:hypothetical protein
MNDFPEPPPGVVGQIRGRFRGLEATATLRADGVWESDLAWLANELNADLFLSPRRWGLGYLPGGSTGRIHVLEAANRYGAKVVSLVFWPEPDGTPPPAGLVY